MSRKEMVAQSKMKGLIMNRKWIIGFSSLCTLVAAIALSVAESPKAETGPTAESALAADNEFAKAMRDNDANGVENLLSNDYAVIPTNGEVVEGKGTFPGGIRTGVLTKSMFQTTEPRVRLYGNTAVVTTKVVMAGRFYGKPYKDVGERQTEVWVWRDGAWKCVLTHETGLKDMPGVISSDGGQHWTKIQ